MTQLKDSMNNIEKIRQEIERRKKICEGIFERESDTYYQGKAVAYGELLPFIDSLPGEKPSEDLEEAAEKYADGEMMSGLAERAFIAGAEWMREQMMKDYILKETVKRIARGSLGVQDFI